MLLPISASSFDQTFSKLVTVQQHLTFFSWKQKYILKQLTMSSNHFSFQPVKTVTHVSGTIKLVACFIQYHPHILYPYIAYHRLHTQITWEDLQAYRGFFSHQKENSISTHFNQMEVLTYFKK